MSDTRSSDGKYHVKIRDARGVVIGDNNVVYHYFLDERYRPLAEHLIAFDDLIAERTADFMGRAFLDARLAAFMEQYDRGYFVLVGEPGIGKTAWAAHVVREHQALHHFNVSAMGIVRPDQAVENLCTQIIARFQLDQPYLPINAGRDGSLLDKLLRQAAERLSGCKLIIVIDALDEAQMPADVRSSNALYLPSSLPLGVYFILTRRPQPMLLETAPGTPLEVFTLGANLPDNQSDVRAYLSQQSTKPEIAVRLADRHISTERFIEGLVERSAGNFMYLAYLLPDIAAGLFDPLNLTGLPQGLRGYYERFWNELESAKGEGREAWTKFYKPVIGMLAVAREPVSAAWLGSILSVDPDEVADFVLVRWRKFLSQSDSSAEPQCSLYHASFREFLEEKVNVQRYHQAITAFYEKMYQGQWSHITDPYATRHLSHHLYAAREWTSLHRLLASGFLLSKAQRSFRSVLADLNYGIWISEETGLDDFCSLVRYQLLLAGMKTYAEHIPPEMLKAMVHLGYWERALELADFVPNDLQAANRVAFVVEAIVETRPEAARAAILAGLNRVTQTSLNDSNFSVERNEARTSLIIRLGSYDLNQAISLAAGLNDPYFRAEAYHGLAKLAATRNSGEAAHALLQWAHNDVQQIGAHLTTLRLLKGLGHTAVTVDEKFAEQVFIEAWVLGSAELRSSVVYVTECVDIARLIFDLNPLISRQCLEQIWGVVQPERDFFFVAESCRLLVCNAWALHAEVARAALSRLELLVREAQKQQQELDVAESDELSNIIATQMRNQTSLGLAELCIAWATVDPERALQESAAIEDHHEKSIALREIALSLAKSNIAQAVEAMMEADRLSESAGIARRLADVVTSALTGQDRWSAQATLTEAISAVSDRVAGATRRDTLALLIGIARDIDSSLARELLREVLMDSPWIDSMSMFIPKPGELVAKWQLLSRHEQWARLRKSTESLVEDQKSEVLQKLMNQIEHPQEDPFYNLHFALALLRSPSNHRFDQFALRSFFERVLEPIDNFSNAKRDRIIGEIAVKAMETVTDKYWLDEYLKLLLSKLQSPGRESKDHFDSEIAVVQALSYILGSNRRQWWDFVCSTLHEQAAQGSDHIIAGMIGLWPMASENAPISMAECLEAMFIDLHEFFPNLAELPELTNNVQT